MLPPPCTQRPAPHSHPHSSPALQVEPYICEVLQNFFSFSGGGGAAQQQQRWQPVMDEAAAMLRERQAAAAAAAAKRQRVLRDLQVAAPRAPGAPGGPPRQRSTAWEQKLAVRALEEKAFLEADSTNSGGGGRGGGRGGGGGGDTAREPAGLQGRRGGNVGLKGAARQGRGGGNGGDENAVSWLGAPGLVPERCDEGDACVM